jgi:phage terminase large subunit
LSTTLEIPTARVFAPLIAPKRYKAAWGGRGSGKSHFFAGLMVERAFAEPGFRGVCVREVQKDLRDSAKKLLEDKIKAMGLGPYFDPQVSQIVTPGGGMVIFQGMQDHNSESIKSLEGFDVAWVEEAQTLSAKSLTMLRPTLRKDGSELWFSWNPRRRSDPVDDFFRGENRTRRASVVKANWSDNPWFPQELEDERIEDLAQRPEQYEHIWEGDYAKVSAGAYYAQSLIKAKQEGRIGRLAADPLMTIRAIWDIGGTGAKADACSIWIAQFIGREIRVLDHYTAQGQPLATHVSWLREKGYGKALCILPHDGSTNDKVFDVSYESALRDAQFEVIVVPNQGKGAAMMRIEAARRLFPSIWFNEATTEAGRDALGAYHEKRDEARGIGLGPNHDWASHDADAFGLMCVAYEEPQQARTTVFKPINTGGGGWLSL